MTLSLSSFLRKISSRVPRLEIARSGQLKRSRRGLVLKIALVDKDFEAYGCGLEFVSVTVEDPDVSVHECSDRHLQMEKWPFFSYFLCSYRCSIGSTRSWFVWRCHIRGTFHILQVEITIMSCSLQIAAWGEVQCSDRCVL